MASQQLYRLAVADAASRYYAEYPDAEVSQPSDTLNGEGSMSFDLPIEDPNIGAVQVVTREAVLFRDGLSAPFWRGPIVRYLRLPEEDLAYLRSFMQRISDDQRR